MKKFLLMVFSAFMLAACGPDEGSSNKKSEEAKGVVNTLVKMEEMVDFVPVKTEKGSWRLERGIFSVCLEGKAYILGSQNTTTMIPVMDAGEQISCVDKYKTLNIQNKHGNASGGFYTMCLGGYKFSLFAEGKPSTAIVQNFESQGVASFCIPENKSPEHLNNLLFIHPKLKLRIKEYQDFVNSWSDKLLDNEKKDLKPEIH